MKVMLFVQNDGERPKCVATVPRILPAYFLTAKAWAKDRIVANNADRWWLVEAEGAEEAREAIAKFGEHFPVGSGITVPRILASGGRS